MNIFFTRKYKYTIFDSVENVRNEFDAIVKRKWYDFSVNITGRFIDNNNFRLTSKWSLTYIRWLETDPAYITGTIIPEDGVTKLVTTLRPNSVFVVAFYFISIIFLLELFGFNTFLEGPKSFILSFLPFFNLIILSIILFSTNRLQNRFERIMSLHRDE